MSARRRPAFFAPGHETVLDMFVEALRTRGWHVAETALTLDNSAVDVDLIVLRAGAGGAPDGETAAALIQARARGAALLIEAAFDDHPAWAAALGVAVVPLAQDDAALWRWWRPGRLVEEMVRNTPAETVETVVIGLNWTLVITENGAGLAQTPVKSAPGCRPLSGGGLSGRRLDYLAAWAHAHNPLARAVGVAAINAGLNHATLAGDDEDGLAPIGWGGPGPTVVVGRFPGLDAKLPGALVLEQAPGPGDMPAEAAPQVVPACGELMITASTLVSAGLETLLALNESDAPVTLVGPGTPLSPRLFAHGIDRLAGFVVEDPSGAARTVAEAGGAKHLRAHGRVVTLRRTAASQTSREKLFGGA